MVLVLALVEVLDKVAPVLELGLAQGLERELAQGLALAALGALGGLGLGLAWELAQALDMAGLVVVGLGPATVLGVAQPLVAVVVALALEQGQGLELAALAQELEQGLELVALAQGLEQGLVLAALAQALDMAGLGVAGLGPARAQVVGLAPAQTLVVFAVSYTHLTLPTNREV